MNAGARIERTVGALVCAYIVVLQLALGGFASADHAFSAMGDPFGSICHSVVVGDPESGEGTERANCCALACAPLAFAAPASPEPHAFAYDPRPTPRRTLDERDARNFAGFASPLKRPRGPPIAA